MDFREVAEEAVRQIDRCPLRVLDVGCGQHLKFAIPKDAEIVGVDISREALDLNEAVTRKVVADIERDPLPAGPFDVAVCWMVLEHVRAPEPILDQMRDRLDVGGRLVISVPNVASPKGIFTKLTPHRFHIWFGRRFLGYTHAGEPGYPPFPTFLRRGISPGSMKRWAANHHLDLVAEEYREMELQRRIRTTNTVTRALWRAVRFPFALSGGRPETSDLLLILEKRK